MRGKLRYSGAWTLVTHAHADANSNTMQHLTVSCIGFVNTCLFFLFLLFLLEIGAVPRDTSPAAEMDAFTDTSAPWHSSDGHNVHTASQSSADQAGDVIQPGLPNKYLRSRHSEIRI